MLAELRQERLITLVGRLHGGLARRVVRELLFRIQGSRFRIMVSDLRFVIVTLMVWD